MQLAKFGLPHQLVRLGTGVHNRTGSSALINIPLPKVLEKGNCYASRNIRKDSTFETSKPLKPKMKADI
jgi:hypothetical protein